MWTGDKVVSKVISTKNLGRKSLEEVKEILATMGLSFGMKVDKKGMAAPASGDLS